ncbi:MAG: DUF3179 domain-containing protein [Bacteroidota bacterium]
MKNTLFFSLVSILLLFSCSKENSTAQQDWLIPVEEVRDGGPGKDGIPSIDNPQFVKVSEVNFLDDNDLVVGMVHNGVAKAYPHPILDWHEIVNDEIDDRQVALTYCPLTGTAIAWNRNIEGQSTTFGVSGKLYNSNLIPYDRASDSYWSQANLNCVNGERIGTVIEIFPILETTWGNWKNLYPNSDVLSTQTGFSRDYMVYPYGDYRTNNSNILFPINPSDNRLPAKERVLGVLHKGSNKVYSINRFDTPQIISDQLGGDDLMIIGSRTLNFIVAFHKHADLGTLSFKNDSLPIVASDDLGNEIDITGKVISGPLAGTQLNQPNAFIGYWFTFGAFYPGIDIYQ